MYLLQELPTTAFIQPIPFIPGSRKNVVLVLQKMKTRSYGQNVINDWEDFAQRFPQNDSVDDYIKENPDAMHIPFHDILFKGVPYITNNVNVTSRTHCLPEVETTACVRWSMRGTRTGTNFGKLALINVILLRRCLQLFLLQMFLREEPLLMEIVLATLRQHLVARHQQAHLKVQQQHLRLLFVSPTILQREFV